MSRFFCIVALLVPALSSCSNEDVVLSGEICRFEVVVDPEWYDENFDEYVAITNNISSWYLQNRIGSVPDLVDNQFSYSDYCESRDVMRRFDGIPAAIRIDVLPSSDADWPV